MHRFAIREGWTIVILTSLIVWIAVLSIQAADWADGLSILNTIMLAGLVAGFIVSKWRRIPSPALHLGGFIVGVIVVLYGMTEYLNDAVGGRRDKLRWLWDRGERWFDQIINGQSTEDLYLFIFFISVLTFVMAYLTMWFVLRARWIWAALFFPGIVLLLNLGYSLKVPTGLVVLFVFVAMLLLMRFTLLEREINWRRVRMEYPGSLMWRGMWVASYLALAVIIFGWAVPVSARSGQANDLWEDVDGPWRTVEDQFSNWFVGLRGPGGLGIGGFAAFSESFELGGPLRLSDKEVVFLDGARSAPYLAAHKYNVYTGRGWQSDVNDTYPDQGAALASGSVSPQIELKPGESLPQDERFSVERERETYKLIVQRPRGSLMYTPGAFVSSDTGSNLVVSWRFYDETIDVQNAGPDDVPAEIWPMVDTLQNADFTPDIPPTPTVDPSVTAEPSPSPTPVPNPRIVPEVEEERARLAEREIFVSNTIDPSTWNAATMTFSGYFPVYSDVEAVRAREGLSRGTQYSVESLMTTSTSHQLRQAGAEYPQEIIDRYLQLPDSVTERTILLAQEITRDSLTTYDSAKALETYLRTNITYSESVAFPPADVDVVDFVLFETQEGYCEYYASAFIVMARSLGIPARMAVGFYPTDEKVEGGFLYRERNAHAWPEVYFAGYGWIGFEPTAARSEVNREPAPPADSSIARLPEDLRGEGLIGGASGQDLDQAFTEENFDLPTGTGAINSENSGISNLGLLVRIVPMLLLLLILVVIYLWMRGTRGLSQTSRFYTKLARGASWGGVKAESHMTPHEYANAVNDKVPGVRQPVNYLTDIYVQETYSEKPVSQAQLLRARQAWNRLRGLFLKYFFVRLKPWGKRKVDDDGSDDW